MSPTELRETEKYAIVIPFCPFDIGKMGKEKIK
jgi:hypothetical protein